MKKCELCNSVAKMYCDSDQASLCWDCDTRVHMANFLVAKHSRTLLCHVCQSPTPWTASGSKLGQTISVCQGCANSNTSTSVAAGDRDHENDREEEEEEEDDDDQSDRDDNEEEDDSSDEDDGDNQVVPLSSTPLSPPVSSTSSSSEDSSKRFSQRRFSVSTSRIGFFSNCADKNATFSSHGDRMERSQQKQDYKIS